jgi:adenylate cyclase
MSLRSKTLVIFIPLIALSLALTAFSSTLAARNSVTRVGNELMLFKVESLLIHADTQWQVLIDNQLAESPEFIVAAQAAVLAFAETLPRGPQEYVLAIRERGEIAMATAQLEPSAEELGDLVALFDGRHDGWAELAIDGQRLVAQTTYFAPFDWLLIVAQREADFYSGVNAIYLQAGVLLAIMLIVASSLAWYVARSFAQPIEQVASGMQQLIATGDLSQRVAVRYRDEAGRLAHTFNLMTDELRRAYTNIKDYAQEAVVARRHEQRIRNIFQKYVPDAVIQQFFARPDEMLRGVERPLAVLFSDVRDFSRTMAPLSPVEVVDSLNAYFGRMSEVVFEHGGWSISSWATR